LRTKVIVAASATVVVLFTWAIFARALAPSGNTSAQHFDAIVVLGTPAGSDGNPTPSQIARVSEAVREYERGVAPRLILTGGPTYRDYVEADVMARVARAQGVPDSAIFEETEARDTIHNACYSVRIMNAHGWRSAEVISAAPHLPRAAMIFSRRPISWRTHPAPSMEPESAGSPFTTSMEVLKTLRYLVYANWAERCTP
jgi:uncharacterized SAM-binding protein YcdF (DUF218 family)